MQSNLSEKDVLEFIQNKYRQIEVFVLYNTKFERYLCGNTDVCPQTKKEWNKHGSGWLGKHNRLFLTEDEVLKFVADKDGKIPNWVETVKVATVFDVHVV